MVGKGTKHSITQRKKRQRRQSKKRVVNAKWRMALLSVLVISVGIIALSWYWIAYVRPITRVVLPEGLNRFEIAQHLETQCICKASEFVQLTQDAIFLARFGIQAQSAEGYLFPDTYEFRCQTPSKDVASKLIQHAQRKHQSLLKTHAEALELMAKQFGWGLHQVVLFASLIEEEAAIASERRVISGVFINRLKSEKLRRLQTDPSVVYGCLHAPDSSKACKSFDGTHITKAMLRDTQNAYNTYKHAGLPPGPISNPGIASLEAALNPAKHNYYYFMAKGDRTHQFSQSYSEHKKAVELYRH